MIRAIADIGGGIAAVATMVGAYLRWARGSRRRPRPPHAEYVRELRRENDELDAELDRVERRP